MAEGPVAVLSEHPEGDFGSTGTWRGSRAFNARAPIMETYPIDLDPEQIVRWIVAEQKTAPSAFRVNARRTTEVGDVPSRKEIHLGDEEREDLREMATIATLEIAPSHASDGWLLTVAVEDENGPPVLDGEEKIALGRFCNKISA